MELVAWLIPVAALVLGLAGVLAVRWHRSTRLVPPTYGPSSALSMPLAYTEYGGGPGAMGGAAAGGGGDCGGGDGC